MVAIEFELIPMRTVYAGMLMWPADRAREVLQAWREWTAAVPDSVTTSIRIMNLPPLPELPDFLRGRSIVVVDGAVLTPPADGRILPGVVRARVLAALRAAGTDVRERPVRWAELARATEVFVTNSVAGVHPVGAVDGLGRWEPGPVLRALGPLLG